MSPPEAICFSCGAEFLAKTESSLRMLEKEHHQASARPDGYGGLAHRCQVFEITSLPGVLTASDVFQGGCLTFSRRNGVIRVGK